MSDRYELQGYVRAAEDRAGFAVLVFRTAASNRLFGQVVDGFGAVTRFAPLDLPSFVAVDAGLCLAVSIGEQALWAYCHPGEVPLVGSRTEVVEGLRGRLRDIQDPLLRLQAAEFCGVSAARAEAWRGSFDALARAAPASADAWRDLVVLPRHVRLAVSKVIEAQGMLGARGERWEMAARDLGGAVGVDVRRGALSVTLEAGLFDLLGTRPSALAEIEAEVTEVREAFGLSFVPIVRGANATALREGGAGAERPVVAAGDHAVAVVDALLRTPERRARPPGRGGHGPAHLRTGIQPLVVADGTSVLCRADAFSDDLPDLLGDAPARGASPLPMLFAVSPGQAALVERLASLAEAARLRGWVPVAIVPHLPDATLMRDPEAYRSLLGRIGATFARTWLISEQSAHGRSGLPFGPSRSVDAAAGRLAGLLASLPPAVDPSATGADGDGAIEVEVLSSAVAAAGLSPPRLLERAIGRATDAALRIGPSTEADADLPAAAAFSRMDDAERLLSDMAPGGGRIGWDRPPRRSSAEASLRISRVRWSPLGLSDFADACVAELERHGWRLARTDVAAASFDATKDGLRVPVTFRPSGNSNATRPLGSRTLRRSLDDVLVLTDATIHRGDFARQLVDGHMPLHFGRVASMVAIWKRRHLHLIRALRGTAALQDRTVARAALDLLAVMHASGRLSGTLSRLMADGVDLDEERSFVARFPDAVRIDVAVTARAGVGDRASRVVGVVLTPAGWMVGDHGV